MRNSLLRRGGSRTDGVGMLGVGILIGAAIGATAALLMAPATGADTRRVLKRKARRLAHQSSEFIDDARSDAERIAKLGLKRARRQAAQARAVAQHAARDVVDVGRRRLGLD